MDVLILLIVIYVIYKLVRNSFKSRTTDKQASNTSSCPPQTGNTINYNYDDFEIFGDTLRKYTGTRDTIVVPRGIVHISNIEFPIYEKTIDTIYIPRSVKRLGDSALAYCEAVCYEGSEHEWNQISIASGNFSTGWMPDWCKDKPLMQNYRVTEVRFQYNTPSSIWNQ